MDVKEFRVRNYLFVELTWVVTMQHLVCVCTLYVPN